ncbi:hypothetical protein QYE76_023890 [Lolium multiflorum]|uniref:Uncharacterized protein n=2 Tax=Lolium TaxID=4520 RepID=A0AAD8RFP9_LOLMU|nr:hypothetical protein QYE76_023890 [Lolium multiflorum]
MGLATSLSVDEILKFKDSGFSSKIGTSGCAKVVFFIYLCDAILALLLDCLFINYAYAYETVTMMGSRGTTAVLSRAVRMRQKLQSALEASTLDIEDVSYQHAGHAAVKDNANETHFNIKVISPKFEGQSLVKRHRMVYDLLTDELNSGLHAISIVAKTPKESGS